MAYPHLHDLNNNNNFTRIIWLKKKQQPECELKPRRLERVHMTINFKANYKCERWNSD